MYEKMKEKNTVTFLRNNVSFMYYVSGFIAVSFHIVIWT